jgi:hypothetical protein
VWESNRNTKSQPCVYTALHPTHRSQSVQIVQIRARKAHREPPARERTADSSAAAMALSASPKAPRAFVTTAASQLANSQNLWS